MHGGAEIHYSHENPNRTVARTSWSRDRVGIARARVLEVRHCSRALAARRSTGRAPVLAAGCHCRSHRLRRRLAGRLERAQEAILESHRIWPETFSLMQAF